MKRFVLPLIVAVVVICMLVIPVMQRAHATVHPAATQPPVTLAAIATNSGNDLPQQIFRPGKGMFLSLDMYNHLGGQYLVTLQVVAYTGSYYLFNNSETVSISPGVDDNWMNYNVIIPSNVYLGTYQYRVTMQQSGYANESRSMTFKIVR